MKVLMAVGEKNLSQILKGNFVDAGFEVAQEEVLHRDYLDEKIDFERPDLLILHDRQLPSQYDDKQQNEEELIKLIEKWRRIYDTQMRVVVMCERERKDPFLGQLVSRNVLDIFNERQIPTASFIQQLQSPPKYMNVARYGLTESDIDSLMDSGEKPVAQSESEDTPVEAQKNSFLKAPKLPKIPKSTRPLFTINFPEQVAEQKEIALQQRQVILVVSPFERSGSTFISHQLAHAIAKKGVGVKYFENPFKIPYTFDRLAGATDVPNYFSPYSEIMEMDHREYIREWTKEGVGIQALNPEYEQQLEEEQFSISRFLRQLLSVHDSPYLIVDIGCDESKQTYDELVEVASHVLVVVDSDLPKLELFSQYQMSPKFGWIHNLLLERKTHLIANKFVKAVESSLPLDEYTSVPHFNPEQVYRAQVEGTFAFKSAKKEQAEGIQQVLKLVLDNKSLKKKTGKVERIKNWIPRFDTAKDEGKMEEST
ncbi:hypothetical protein [Planomicrobium okeanokoites]|uniref:hypothetical protein n=1 Tax=Planomicrobium okeanokoites TaxID=244 RepID=UPI00248F9E21|nr:hypothetical protein [Planomicrobium okeanokoites]